VGFPNRIVLPNRLRVANAPKKIPEKRKIKLEIPVSWLGPPKGALPRICESKKPRPKTSEAIPRAIRLKEPLDKKLLAKKYATTNALIDKNNECAEENGDGSS
jgi:hypothetical protein